MNTNEFMKQIYAYEKELGNSENILKGDLLKEEEREFISENSNAFLFGLIADQSVKAETAWSLPYKLKEIIRHIFLSASFPETVKFALSLRKKMRIKK